MKPTPKKKKTFCKNKIVLPEHEKDFIKMYRSHKVVPTEGAIAHLAPLIINVYRLCSN